MVLGAADVGAAAGKEGGVCGVADGTDTCVVGAPVLALVFFHGTNWMAAIKTATVATAPALTQSQRRLGGFEETILGPRGSGAGQEEHDGDQ